MPMETVLICLLLLYNAWLVSYILSGRQRKSPPQVEDKPPSKPPHRGDDIVGKSRFKMQTKVPQDSRPEPQAAKADEGEEVTDIAVTFADDKDETPPARIPDDELDEAFTDIRIEDIRGEYADDEGGERTPAKRYATGASFEEIGEAVKVADNSAATADERQRAAQIFSELEGNALFERIIESSPERAKKITGLMDEVSGKSISGEGKEVGNAVHPQNTLEVPADISGFDIRDFV